MLLEQCGETMWKPLDVAGEWCALECILFIHIFQWQKAWLRHTKVAGFAEILCGYQKGSDRGNRG